VTEIGLPVIAVLALVLAAVMASVAWRLSRAERRRSAARVATLAADLREVESLRPAAVGGRRLESRIQPVAIRRFDDDDTANLPLPVSAPSPDLFRFEESNRSESRLAPVLVIGTCALVVVLALIFTVGRAVRPPATSTATAPSVSSARPLSGSVPVELVTLGQVIDRDRMTVRGTVRNPRSGQRFDRLVAVVTFFDRDGKMIGSGRAPVQPPALAPGSQSAFAVTMAHAQDVARYRVRFHVDDRLVAHIDRRSDNRDASPLQQ
jgi:hypothetical protein